MDETEKERLIEATGMQLARILSEAPVSNLAKLRNRARLQGVCLGIVLSALVLLCSRFFALV